MITKRTPEEQKIWKEAYSAKLQAENKKKMEAWENSMIKNGKGYIVERMKMKYGN